MNNSDINWQPDHLEHERIRLKPLQESHFAELYSVASDPLIWEQHPSRDRYQNEAFKLFFQQSLEAATAFVIQDTLYGDIIGSTRFYDFDPHRHSIAIGYTFMARKYWGGKVNKIVKALMLDYAFGIVDKVIFHIGATNIRSQMATTAIGAKWTSEFYKDSPNGKTTHFEYTLTREEWSAKHKGTKKMQEVYIRDKTFDKNDFKEIPLEKGEYEGCTFKNCNFSEGDLSGFRFTDCAFIACNLSLTKLNKTALQDIKFRDAKMLGLHFGTCNEFNLSFSFENCVLNHSSFYKTKIKKTSFKNCQLQETDFTECDLTSAVFDSCDLMNATFEKSILEKADFRNAYNYSIDPEINRIKKAKFSTSGISGLLDKYDIDIEGNA